MAITRTNVYANPTSVHNSPSVPTSTGKENEKVIKIHKSYDDAVSYAERIVMPTGVIDTVFYRDENKKVQCLLVVGNIPGQTPIIFSGTSYVTTTIENNVSDATERASEVITETVTTNTEKIIDGRTQWQQFQNSSLGEDSGETAAETDASTGDNVVIIDESDEEESDNGEWDTEFA